MTSPVIYPLKTVSRRSRRCHLGLFCRVSWILLFAWNADALRPSATPAHREAETLLSVSRPLYELDILILRQIGHNADAFELLRRQFRVVARPESTGPLFHSLARPANNFPAC